MKKQLHLLAMVLVLFAWAPQGQSQCLPSSYEYLDGNQVSASFTAGSDRFWDLISTPHYEVPKGSGLNACFASTMWIGGLDGAGSLHMAASTYRQNGNDFYAGPIRRGYAYNCGRGFETPVPCFSKGMFRLSSGLIANYYANGLQIYDPQAQTAIQRILPNEFVKYAGLELPSGQLLLVSTPSPGAGKSLAMLFDPNGFPLPQVDTLNFLHPFGALTYLPTGKVLVVSFNGAELYDPTSHTASIAASSAAVPSMPSLVTLNNGLAFLTAGTSSHLYDANTNTWTPSGTWTGNRNSPTLVTLQNGEILILGGNQNLTTTERYNPASNTLTPGPSLPGGMVAVSAEPYGFQEIVLVGMPQDQQGDVFFLNWNTGAIRQLRQPAASVPMVFDGNMILSGWEGPSHFVYIDPITGHVLDQRWQDVWKVSRSEVQQFQQDFAANAVNFVNYPDIQTWPGNGNPFLGEDAQLAPYIDQDQDGIYDPYNDGDYPCFPGDQAIWWVYNDDGMHTETGGQPLGVQVENLSYVFDCNVSPCPDTALDYATFHHVEISNYGTSDLHDLHLGTFLDFDLGNYADDYVGNDSALGLSFVYNADANDESAAGYGLNPPAFGAALLPNGEIDHMGGSMYWNNDFSVTGNPEIASDYYGYLQQNWKDGSHLVNNGGNGHNGSGSGAPTNFIFNGDPGFCGGASIGWSEQSAGNQPFDRRSLQTFGPLNFAVGQTIKLDYALLFARDQSSGNNLASVCKLKANTATIQNWWSTQLDRSCLELVTSRPEGKPAPTTGMHVAPNPNAGHFVLSLDAATTRPMTVALHNLQGQAVWTGKLGAGQTSLDIATEGLASGLYLLLVQDGLERTTHKIVIER